jgi:hypothetical protein
VLDPKDAVLLQVHKKEARLEEGDVMVNHCLVFKEEILFKVGSPRVVVFVVPKVITELLVQF